MVILILLVRRCRSVSGTDRCLPVHTADRIPEQNRRQSFLLEHADCRFHHALLSDRIADIHRLLRADIDPHRLKSLDKALHIRACQTFDLLLRKLRQILRHPKLIFTDIFAIRIQIIRCHKVTLHDDVICKWVHACNRLPDSSCNKHIRIVIHIVIDSFFDLLLVWKLLSFGCSKDSIHL